MAVVQFGVFEEFKGQTTLLVWSDGAGVAKLATQLRDMADGRISTMEFGKLPWAHSGQSTEVTLRVVPPGFEGENLSRLGDKWRVEWRAWRQSSQRRLTSWKPSCPTKTRQATNTWIP